MTLAQVTRAAVLDAITQFDRLGRDSFIRSSGFGRAREYYLDYGGKLYDSKPIVGYARGVATGQPLTAADSAVVTPRSLVAWKGPAVPSGTCPTRTGSGTRSSWRASWSKPGRRLLAARPPRSGPLRPRRRRPGRRTRATGLSATGRATRRAIQLILPPSLRAVTQSNRADDPNRP